MKPPFIHQFMIGDMRNFIYLLLFENGNAYIVDPQPDLAVWETLLGKNVLKGILLTHSHHDHVGGVGLILNKYPDTKVFLHSEELHRLKNISQDRLVFLNDGQNLEAEQIEVIYTPGHSKGECSFFLPQARSETQNRSGKPISFKGPHLISGDTVFIGNVGRTDFVGGSDEEMFHSLQRLKKLPPETLILSGHDYGKEPVNSLQDEMSYSEAWQCKTIQELASLP